MVEDVARSRDFRDLLAAFGRRNADGWWFDVPPRIRREVLRMVKETCEHEIAYLDRLERAARFR